MLDTSPDAVTEDMFDDDNVAADDDPPRVLPEIHEPVQYSEAPQTQQSTPESTESSGALFTPPLIVDEPTQEPSLLPKAAVDLLSQTVASVTAFIGRDRTQSPGPLLLLLRAAGRRLTTTLGRRVWIRIYPNTKCWTDRKSTMNAIAELKAKPRITASVNFFQTFLGGRHSLLLIIFSYCISIRKRSIIFNTRQPVYTCYPSAGGYESGQ
ncbi:hypothetical protein BSL78_13565 [Apostichopus japonicus]|uniref:Uncharacterized protein n=1 Tax=Stichopus japonicus TaxID=307972 RepID=A0A2G8KNJ6_STIJA|nr:hypothetical protein BSL78_13565 [Apostichopus japonicus]